MRSLQEFLLVVSRMRPLLIKELYPHGFQERLLLVLLLTCWQCVAQKIANWQLAEASCIDYRLSSLMVSWIVLRRAVAKFTLKVKLLQRLGWLYAYRTFYYSLSKEKRENKSELIKWFSSQIFYACLSYSLTKMKSARTILLSCVCSHSD